MEKALEYLYNLRRFGMKLGLEAMEDLLERLNHPQRNFKVIHVAGTNGKGSTSAFIASILQEAGYRVGLYTSPHLIRFNERIKINSQDIDDQTLVKLIEIVKEKAAQPTFFEFTTALAFLHFAMQEVDYAVVEVGLGGRLDATNMVKPELAVITNVASDHMKHLGDNKLSIAREKAGIIKQGCTIVTGEEDAEILSLFKKITLEREAKLIVLDDLLQVFIKRLSEEERMTKIGPNLKEQNFQVTGVLSGDFTISLLGEHQLRNAALAMLVCVKLGISKEFIEKGLLKTRWTGRLQVVQENPLLIVDGAHNVAGVESLAKFVTSMKTETKKILIVGFSKDKDIEKMCAKLAPLFDEFIITESNYNPASVLLIKEQIEKYNKNILINTNLEKALSDAFQSAGSEDVIFIAGSIYLVGNSLQVLERKKYLRKLYK